MPMKIPTAFFIEMDKPTDVEIQGAQNRQNNL